VAVGPVPTGQASRIRCTGLGRHCADLASHCARPGSHGARPGDHCAGQRIGLRARRRFGW